MKKLVSFSKISVATILFLSLFSSIASAHVEVNPKSSQLGEEETYTMKVPSEKDTPTTKVTLKMPKGVEFDSYQPVTGWNFTTQKDSKGNVISISFETMGEGILPEQFQQFIFAAKNPGQKGKVAWDVYQYYKDGSIVEWTGDESSKSPHSITDIVTQANNQMPGMNMQPKETKKAAATTSSTSNNTVPLILSIVAVLLSFVALVLAARKR